MKPTFNRRKATSFGLLFSFLIMLASGLILWIFPRIASFGMVAEFGGLTKPAWLNQHIVFGILFALFSLYHLFGVNREPFFAYLKKSASNGLHRRPELLTTLLATALIATVTAMHLQPVSNNVTPGNPIALADDRYGDDSDADSERSHHHHADEEYDERNASSRVADRDTAEKNDAVQFSAEDRNSAQPANNGAPNDELHRRTTKSCASCH
jgi:uncharacterized iron-regulated membrane protein